MEKNWNDKWLSRINQSRLQDLFKLVSVLKDNQETLGKETFEISYQEFQDKGVTGNVQKWLRNLWRRGVITIWYKNKSHGTMRFSVDTPYDEYEEENISSGAEVELNSEKFEAVYLWLEGHVGEALDTVNETVNITEQEARVLSNRNELQESLPPKEFIKQLLNVYKFPKKQKRLLSILSDKKPHETKSLKTAVDTDNLASLKVDTIKKIKYYGLNKVLSIQKSSERIDFGLVYYYQLEIYPEFFQYPKVS